LIGADSVRPAVVVRNLGLQLECDLSMNTHISMVVSTCFGILRRLRSVARSLPRDAKRQLIQTFVLSRVDYCNVAFAGIPKRQTDRLQAIINASARLVSGTRKFDHITPVLRDDLHLLMVPERIEFKLCLLVHKCLHNLAPSYLQVHIKPLSLDSSRSRLRSSKTGDVLVPLSHCRSGDRAFCTAAPRAWNNLPVNIKIADSLMNFKKLLKTHLFKKSYNL